MFEAKYGGRCDGCGERIKPGEQVTYVDDVLIHVGCVDVVPRRQVKPAEVCQQCWLEKPCGCGEF